MDPIENSRSIAREIISFARDQQVDLEPLGAADGHFQKDQRWIFLWRKDEHPWSGPANERLGTLHYNMQGAIAVLPSKLRDSASAFRGIWAEAGTLENVEKAFEFLKAWLIERKEVDDLPGRSVRRFQI